MRLLNFVFNVFVIYPIIALWRLNGWRAEGAMPNVDKFIMIAVPHTSNWDYLIMIPLAMHFRRRPMTLIKSSVFRWPLAGRLVRMIGGIPVDRGKSTNFVVQTVDLIDKRKKIALVIAPEGTRRKTDTWRSGFYYIALQAGIPIVPGYLDYARKVGGVGPALMPSGDIHADMAILAAFYSTHGHGKYPENAAPVGLKVQEDAIKELVEV